MRAVDVEGVGHHLARDLPNLSVAEADGVIDPVELEWTAVDAEHLCRQTRHART